MQRYTEHKWLYNFYIPKDLVAELDELVRKGLFRSRADAVRCACADLVERLSRLPSPNREMRAYIEV